MKKILFAIGTIFLSTISLLAGAWDWIKIIVDILALIFSGHSANASVEIMSEEYDISQCEIWRHGGFGHEDEMPIRCKDGVVNIPSGRR